MRAASHGGVHVAYDGVGKATFDASMASLRRRGTLALFGAASGPVPPVDPQRLNSGGSLFLTRPTLAHFTAERDELLWRSGEILSAIADGSLQIDIGGTYPLDRAADAYRALEGRADDREIADHSLIVSLARNVRLPGGAAPGHTPISLCENSVAARHTRCHDGRVSFTTRADYRDALHVHRAWYATTALFLAAFAPAWMLGLTLVVDDARRRACSAG